ncbi:MAG: hypothetical protein JWN03_1180 [Nocardia sp.]|uniref:hypothetical protein n=1 Tax=Nocardia sp. TaxID=1821 RepID=UPI00261DF4A4|nr:hypothetical protein [Nocardia sp.]MCU1640905.1 hypothetical protein [Nocardia sp.]
MSTHLPVHPIFGAAIGLRRNGTPIWTIRGGSEDTDPTGATPTDPGTLLPPTADEDDLGEGGEKALKSERAARRAAEKTARENATQAQELAKRLQAIEDANKTDTEKQSERIAVLKKDAAKAIRYEAAEKTGLSLSLAQRLKGGTLDEMIADAEELKGLIGSSASQQTTPPAAPGTPKSDRRQGGGGGETTGSMAAGRAAYEARKNRK